ncbi:MAG: VWA domain-containing protein, partial [Polyangiaceae bacterium]|nr:VWA domain-containing protein [Polyangiaceae bacterium]
MRSRTWRNNAGAVVFLVALGLLAGGCGAKTGLNTPDAQVVVDAGVDATIPCFEVPLDGGPVNVDLEVEAEVGRADVVFLVDTTGSMNDEISVIRARLRDRIVPAIRSAIPDSELAVATFADFPVRPYGNAGEDTPFRLMTPRTSDVTLAQAAVDAIRLGNGIDPPESQVEALYQLATGEGLSPYVSPSLGCPAGGLGYACLRSDALPVILLFTDAEMHNGPGGANPYEPSILGVSPHTFAEAISALDALGAKVIGFDSGDGAGRPHLRAVALGTGTLDGRGQPLVF